VQVDAPSGSVVDRTVGELRRAAYDIASPLVNSE
jgi:hypothetical protein